jgi:phosphate transport system permease protein
MPGRMIEAEDTSTAGLTAELALDAAVTPLGASAAEEGSSPLSGVRGASLSTRAGRERLIEAGLLAAAVLSGAAVVFVIAFIAWRAAPLFAHQGLSWIWRSGWDQAVSNAWHAPDTWEFGVGPLIIGTIITTAASLLFAGTIGIGCAIFLALLAPDWLARPVEGIVRLLSGIPSVVFGLIGLTVVVPWIQRAFITDALGNKYPDVPLDGTSFLAAIIVLTFMILPFFVTVATDALRAVPSSYRLGGLAVGMTEWRAITRLVVPSATPGLVAGLVLAAARAVGEAIALAMVAGSLANVPQISHGFVAFLEPLRTMASAIVDNGESLAAVPEVQAALFGLALLLLLFSLTLSVAARVAFGWFSKRMGLVSERRV